MLATGPSCGTAHDDLRARRGQAGDSRLHAHQQRQRPGLLRPGREDIQGGASSDGRGWGGQGAPLAGWQDVAVFR